jgi:nucleoid-associated protein YgaU
MVNTRYKTKKEIISAEFSNLITEDLLSLSPNDNNNYTALDTVASINTVKPEDYWQSKQDKNTIQYEIGYYKKKFIFYMSIILSEELHRINYLFGHKRGVVISEQAAPGGLKGNYDDEKKEYTVSKGDTLGKIGKSFGVAWRDIFEKNKETLKSKNPNLIYPGEKLIIPIKEKPKVDEPITSETEPEKPKVDEPITS